MDSPCLGHICLFGANQSAKIHGKFIPHPNHRALKSGFLKLIPKSNGSLVCSNVPYSIAIGGIYGNIHDWLVVQFHHLEK